MAAGHDEELLRRLDVHGRRIEAVEEAAMNGDLTEAEVRWKGWRARLSGANALSVLTAVALMAILAGVTALCAMNYVHMQDTRDAGVAFAKIMKEGNVEFVAAMKELTAVQREGNCLTRTKGVDPELCRSVSR